MHFLQEIKRGRELISNIELLLVNRLFFYEMDNLFVKSRFYGQRLEQSTIYREDIVTEDT